MRNINTASNLAQLIMGLPKALWSLPVFYEDCDCGKGLHEVNSLYPDRDAKGRIYLRPSSAHHQVTDILAEYNRLNVENEEIHKRVEKARAEGIEVQTHNEPPEGWDKCVLKTNTGRVVACFDPHKEKHANGIIAYFRDAIMNYHCIRIPKDEVTWKYLDVGYPGNRHACPFKLDHLDIQMIVDDMEVTPYQFPHDGYMHLKLHFKVQINWKPDLSDPRWKDMDVKYDHLDVYEFDDTLTLMLLPPGAEGEAAGKSRKEGVVNEVSY